MATTTKAEPNLTCDACLRGQPWRCKGPGCASWQKTTIRVRKRPKRETPPAVGTQRRKPGRPKGSRNLQVVRAVKTPPKPALQRGPRLPLDVQHRVAEDLLYSHDGRHRIAARHHVTYEQVRTVSRNLAALDAAGLGGPKREVVELTLDRLRIAVVHQHEVGLDTSPRVL